MSGKLVLVGTPIGNLSDFSPRAAEALSQADFIAAEDTRVTVKLLNHFAIKKPLVSYFEHNKAARGPVLCDRMEAGETCALVTDAGMPAISDPGELLVEQCAERGIPVPSKVRDSLKSASDETNKAVYTYIEKVSDGYVSDVGPSAPAAASSLTDIFKDLEQQIVYGKATPAQAYQKLTDQVSKLS